MKVLRNLFLALQKMFSRNFRTPLYLARQRHEEDLCREVRRSRNVELHYQKELLALEAIVQHFTDRLHLRVDKAMKELTPDQQTRVARIFRGFKTLEKVEVKP